MRKIILTAVALLSLAACGTDTGNPVQLADTTDPQAGIGSPVGEWTAAMCERLRTCLSAVPADCAARVEAASSVTAALGLDAAIYPDLSAVSRAVASEALHLESGESAA